jgi:hypothetical protein
LVQSEGIIPVPIDSYWNYQLAPNSFKISTALTPHINNTLLRHLCTTM